MASYKHCDFFLLRYVPDLVKQEFVNVGVVMLEEGEGGFTDVRFTHDWRRVRCLDPEVDIELLQSYEDELRRLLQSRASEVINYKLPMSRREWLLDVMQQSFSGALQLAPMQGVLTESPQAELGILARGVRTQGRCAPGCLAQPAAIRSVRPAWAPIAAHRRTIAASRQAATRGATSAACS